MTKETLTEWMALYIIERSASEAEPTKWDSDAVMSAKLKAIAKSKL